jgi:hypothetical protein
MRILKAASALSFAFATALTLLLMKGFVRDNLGSDFIEIRMLEGVKVPYYVWDNIVVTGVSLFVPLFVGGMLAASFLLYVITLIWAALRDVVQSARGREKRKDL